MERKGEGWKDGRKGNVEKLCAKGMSMREGSGREGERQGDGRDEKKEKGRVWYQKRGGIERKEMEFEGIKKGYSEEKRRGEREELYAR